MPGEYEKRGYLLEDYRYFHLRDERCPEVDTHYHEFYKLTYLLSGHGSYMIEGRWYRIEPGDLVIVRRGEVHRPEIETDRPYERIILYLSSDFFRAAFADDPIQESFARSQGHVIRSSKSFSKRLRTHFDTVEKELSSDEPGARSMARAVVIAALVEILRVLLSSAFETLTAEPGDEKVQAILRYLNEHITEDVAIDALSERFYISKYHMMRRFREETGVPIHAYLAEKRLLLARELIASGCSATDACYRSGYQSYSSFSRAYRKRFASSPTGRVNVYTGSVIE